MYVPYRLTNDREKMSSLLQCIAVSVVCLSLLQIHVQAAPKPPHKPSPIVIVPALTGSQLHVKDDGDENGRCSTRGKLRGLWMDFGRLLNIQCLKRELLMKYDPDTNEFTNKYDGVTIEVPGFGETRTVEYLTTNSKLVPYMKEFVEYFVARGYERGRSIRAAPYDWRLAGDMLQQQGYYDRLKQLIEDTYEDNGQQGVTITGHSMGGAVAYYFLTKFLPVTQEWKDKYVHAFAPIGSSWGGGNQGLQLQISGITFHGLKIPTIMVPITRSLGGLQWMLPSTYIWGDTPIVYTPTRNYSANDFQQLFSDVGYENGYDMYESVSLLSGNFPAPNVNTYCFTSNGSATPEKFIYDEDFLGSNPLEMEPTVIFGDGDGTINKRCNDICLKWEDMRCHYLIPENIEGVSHRSLATDHTIFAKIAKIVGAPEESKP